MIQPAGIRPLRVFFLSAVALVTCVALLSAPLTANAANGDCGQPLSVGASPVATDALFILGAAVAVQTCELCVCDVTDDGAITATDALTTLAAAVGQAVTLNCPFCGDGSCYSSSAPSCGGSCEQGLTCAPDPESSGECECLNACEASSAPTCGGSCDEEEPGTICTPLVITPAGLSPINLCGCVPPDARFCESAQGPECEGFCGANALCESDGGSGCVCAPQAVQPECAAAVGPACLGTCGQSPDGATICESNGAGSCVCVPFVGQGETCFDEDAPVCGGVCAYGDMCVVEFGDCECAPPCEIGSAPSCGGDCLEEGETCVVTTITVFEQSRDFCECWEIER